MTYRREPELIAEVINFLYDEYIGDSYVLIRALRDMGFDRKEVEEYAGWISPETIKEVYEE